MTIEQLSSCPINRKKLGLRDSSPASTIKVYRANPDGTRGEFLREETAEELTSHFTSGKVGRKKDVRG